MTKSRLSFAKPVLDHCEGLRACPRVYKGMIKSDVCQPQVPDYRKAASRTWGWMCILTLVEHLPVRKMGKELQEHPGYKWNDTGFRSFRLREVQYGEFAVVSPGGPVVSFGRPDFTIEAAEKYIPSVEFDPRLPAPLVAFPGNAFVFGTENSVPAFRLISAVLSNSCRAEIGFAIVQTLAIDMVNK